MTEKEFTITKKDSYGVLLCDFGLQEDEKGPYITYLREEGFGRERIRIFPNNLLEKTIMVLKFLLLACLQKGIFF
jgi:hypothetical protein